MGYEGFLVSGSSKLYSFWWSWITSFWLFCGFVCDNFSDPIEYAVRSGLIAMGGLKLMLYCPDQYIAETPCFSFLSFFFFQSMKINFFFFFFLYNSSSTAHSFSPFPSFPYLTKKKGCRPSDILYTIILRIYIGKLEISIWLKRPSWRMHACYIKVAENMCVGSQIFWRHATSSLEQYYSLWML
jgi:hypothetical protein